MRIINKCVAVSISLVLMQTGYHTWLSHSTYSALHKDIQLLPVWGSLPGRCARGITMNQVNSTVAVLSQRTGLTTPFHRAMAWQVVN